MKVIKNCGVYYLVEGIGRYEVLKKDYYYDNNGEKKDTWVLEGQGTNYKLIEEIYKKRIDNNKN